MRKAFILIIPLMFILVGCTTEADRIYTVCKIDNGLPYVYSTSGVYSVSNNTLEPCYDINVEKKPALQLFPTDKDFNFEYVLPGLYKGTLEDVSAYVNFMVTNDSATYYIVNSNPESLEVIVDSSEYSARILYNTSGDVRVYFVDNSNLSIIPLYINGEE